MKHIILIAVAMFCAVQANAQELIPIQAACHITAGDIDFSKSITIAEMKAQDSLYYRCPEGPDKSTHKVVSFKVTVVDPMGAKSAEVIGSSLAVLQNMIYSDAPGTVVMFSEIKVQTAEGEITADNIAVQLAP